MDLDPHWEWVELQMWSGQVIYMKARCRHLEVVDVTIGDGERVARLCITCDAQLPP